MRSTTTTGVSMPGWSRRTGLTWRIANLNLNQFIDSLFAGEGGEIVWFRGSAPLRFSWNSLVSFRHDAAPSPLPNEPNKSTEEDYLHHVARRHRRIHLHQAILVVRFLRIVALDLRCKADDIGSVLNFARGVDRGVVSFGSNFQKTGSRSMEL